jgi:hypothetical protein
MEGTERRTFSRREVTTLDLDSNETCVSLRRTALPLGIEYQTI